MGKSVRLQSPSSGKSLRAPRVVVLDLGVAGLTIADTVERSTSSKGLECRRKTRIVAEEPNSVGG
jgi:hypothetical protein